MDIDQLALDTVEAIANINPDKLKGGRVQAVAKAQCLIRQALADYAAEKQIEALQEIVTVFSDPDSESALDVVEYAAQLADLIRRQAEGGNHDPAH